MCRGRARQEEGILTFVHTACCTPGLPWPPELPGLPGLPELPGLTGLTCLSSSIRPTLATSFLMS